MEGTSSGYANPQGGWDGWVSAVTGEPLGVRVEAVLGEVGQVLHSALGAVQNVAGHVTGEPPSGVRLGAPFLDEATAAWQTGDWGKLNAAASGFLKNMGRMGPVTRRLPNALTVDGHLRSLAQAILDELAGATRSEYTSMIAADESDAVYAAQTSYGAINHEESSTLEIDYSDPNAFPEGSLQILPTSFWVDLDDDGVKGEFPILCADETFRQHVSDYTTSIRPWCEAGDSSRLASLREGLDQIERLLLPYLAERAGELASPEGHEEVESMRSFLEGLRIAARGALGLEIPSGSKVIVQKW